ncbi:lissencephaly-1 homolog isoform X2 [Esox lucius]|uniref:lissencephaly-1 homolog isoform X2 n=1 Tax=Esox lucius TaxID=8010 RepID=UPI00057717B2|nr:lissencephaly-1 homolog isoform X2 [Esox lucius]
MGEVRKLQKKLRQIENLEIRIYHSLTPEEKVKISRKAELRTRLAELLLQLSGPQQTPGIVGEGKQEKMKRQVEASSEALPSHSPSATKIPRIPKGETQRAGQQEKTVSQKEALTRKEIGRMKGMERQRETGSGVMQSEPVPAGMNTSLVEDQEDAEFSSLKASWEKAKFRLRLLEGHSDIITCVVAVDNLVISGSRDTTIKVWLVPTATEQRNLGGHTGGVTCLAAPPPEYCRRLACDLSLGEKERFILSGSTDCCVRIWALSTGQCVKSIYTFNAVTALCFVPEGHGYIIIGSDGGKVQAWSWQTMENCQSINAHDEAITSIQSQGPLVFSGSAEGGLSVWEGLCSDRQPLRLLHRWDAEVTGCRGQGARLTLSPRGDRVFVAYGRASVRIINWRTGTVSRLANHSSVAGLTDCVHQIGGLLIGSCYDLANGESSLNLFSLPQCRYLASLTCMDAPRILCFAAWLTGSGGHRWVTGGRDLMVWEQLPSSGKQRGDVTAKRDSRLDATLTETEWEDEDSDDYDDDDEGGDEEDHTSQNAAESSLSSWLRCSLQ